MTEGYEGNVDNIILAQLRDLREQIRKNSGEIGSLKTEVISLRQHLVGIVSKESVNEIEMSEMKVRLDRIERRLDLIN